jgi:uncharacterized repeat protein (TIGR03803 family)
MIRKLDIFDTCIVGCGLALVALLPPGSAQAAGGFKVLYAFKGGSDGRNSSAALIADSAGNLYGTTPFGATMGCNEGRGCGTVFKLTAKGKETVLYAFKGGSDGAQPLAGLIADSSGNLYGTTEDGGGGNAGCSHGCGTVFKVTPGGAETVLHAFKSGSDGAYPAAGLLADNAGNLYGTTTEGGTTDTCGKTEDQQARGCGIVFKIAPGGAETVLHIFTGGSDGGLPASSLVADGAGNLYGTTETGGSSQDCGDGSYGCGTIFEIAANGTESLLHVFKGGSDGSFPGGSLVADNSGDLYGTTTGGGSADNCGAQKAGLKSVGCGVVYRLASGNAETVLHVFAGGSDGAYPFGGLVEDEAGNLYGTTGGGGSGSNCGMGKYGCGIVFRLATDGTETVLHVFKGGKADGAYPTAGLIADKKGDLYGTTYQGGGKGKNAFGTVFKLKE